MAKKGKKMEMKKNKEESIIGQIFYSPYSIVVVLIVFVIGLLAYSRYLVKCNTLYAYSGYTANFSFLGGTIYEGPLVNHFGDSKVIYTGDDIKLYDFEVGYYIKDGKSYNPISVTKGYDTTDGEEDSKKDENLVSLKELVTKTGFSFTESHKDAMFLSEDNIKNLDNLVFRIVGKDKDDELVEIEVPMVIEKITK